MRIHSRNVSSCWIAPIRASSLGPSLSVSTPSVSQRPLVGRYRPVIWRRRVVLPLPFFPTRPTIDFPVTESETESSAVFLPNRFVTLLSENLALIPLSPIGAPRLPASSGKRRAPSCWGYRAGEHPSRRGRANRGAPRCDLLRPSPPGLFSRGVVIPAAARQGLPLRAGCRICSPSWD